MNNKIEINNGTVQAVNWTAVFPSLKLVKCGREALQPARMGIGLVWVAGMVVGVWVAIKLGLVLLPSPDEAPKDDGAAQLWLACWGIFWSVATLFLGAAASRLAAVQVAAGHPGRLQATAQAVRARAASWVGGLLFLLLPLLVLVGAGVAANYFQWHGFLVLLIVLVLGLSLVILPALLLLIPAIAVDGNDGFDAPGRAVSYVLARPWALALHLLALAFFGAVFVGIPCAVVDGALWVSFGVPMPRWLPVLLFAPIAAYAFSFILTGLTRIYFLIRESADGVPETELWQPSDDQQVTMGVDEA